MLSARAIGIYTYMVSINQVLSAEELSRVFKEGRDAIRAALNELRDADLIWTKRTRVNEKWVSQSGFSGTESQLLESRLQSQLLKLYSQYINIANMPLEAKSYANSETPIGVQEKNLELEKIFIGGSSLSFEYMDADAKEYLAEQQEERRKAKIKADAEKNELRAAHHKEKLAIRDRRRVDPRKWTVSDSAYEFANTLFSRWDVPPWTVSETRFIQSLGTARSKHGTDGLIEQKMTQMFLAEPIVQTMKDANAIWKLYISRFGQLAEQARYAIVDPDKLASAKQASDEARRRMMED